jgi:hypothetical protein
MRVHSVPFSHIEGVFAKRLIVQPKELCPALQQIRNMSI